MQISEAKISGSFLMFDTRGTGARLFRADRVKKPRAKEKTAHASSIVEIDAGR
jgi:hypothetical protein